MLSKKLHRKMFFYTIFLVFILWMLAEPNTALSCRDACFFVLMLFLAQCWIEKKYLYSKLSVKYKNQADLLNNLFLNCPDLVYRKDSNLRYKDCNPIMRTMLNLDKKDSIFNKTDYDFYPRKTAKVIRYYDRQVIKTGRIVSYKIKKTNTTVKIKYTKPCLLPLPIKPT